MLVLTRKIGESIVLPSCDVTIRVMGVSKRRVKLGVTAPPEIPVHRAEVAGRIGQGKGPRSSQAGRPIASVLIADPEPTRLESYRRALGRKGFDVRIAATGVECVWGLRSHTPDVLVLHSGLLWGGAEGVLALMSDPSFGVPPVPLVIQGRVLDRAGLDRKGLHRVDAMGRLLAPSELAEQIRRLLRETFASPDAPPRAAGRGSHCTN
jgi:carbon storage regulator